MNEPTVIQNQQALRAGTTIEGFEIRQVIGLGGFGVVYEAWDAMLERQVALKEYLPGALARRLPNGHVQVREERHQETFDIGLRSFINEARLLAQFDHAALVKVYRFWEIAGTAYMVMPLYRGPNLKQHVEQHVEKQQAPIEESRLLTWLVALTEALEEMHNQQCYHRDVSPENIVIQENTGLPILLDFGAARRVIGHASQPFTVILKASYAPIEQYAEIPSMSQGPWTDVYALAAVAHFLMTGKTPPSSVARMVNDNYALLSRNNDLPFSLSIRKAVDQGLAVQPHDRTQSMREFREALLTTPPDVLDLFDTPGVVDKPLHNHSTRHTHTMLHTVLAKPCMQWAARTLSAGKKFRVFLLGGRLLFGELLLGVLLVLAGLLAFSIWQAPDKPELSATEQAKPTPDQALPDQASPDQAFQAQALPPQRIPNPAMPTEPQFQSVLNRADKPLSIQVDMTVLQVGKDLLSFEIESPFSGHVAVYVHSSDGSLIQLLPNARAPAIAIEANRPLVLPPAHDPVQAAGPAGVNQFLVVVTEQPRSYAHLQFQDHYGFGLIENRPRHAQNSADQAVQGLEGTSPCIPTSCSDRMAAGWFSVEEVN